MDKVFLLSFTTLVTMVNPLAVIPAFITLTDGASRKTRMRVALVAGIACTAVLSTFLLAGNFVFQFFGITVPAFQITGGILFFISAMRTLVEDDRRSYNVGGNQRMEDTDVEKAELDPASIAVVPLAVPMLSGPGAIASTMVLVNFYPRLEQKLAVFGAIACVGAVAYLALLAAVPISRMVGDRGRAVFSKIMSLLLAAIGIQFIINGLKPVITEILRSS